MAFELRLAQVLAHVLVGLEQPSRKSLAAPDLHGVALHQPIGVLARDALLRERDQHALRMHEPAQPVEVLAHVLGIDHELVDDAGEPRQREIERHGGVRTDHALDRGVRDVALVPERDVLQRRRHIGAHHARSPVRFSDSTGLRLCGMAEEPFWPSEKNSSASSTSVRCRWRISVASRSTEEATTPERGEIHRVAVARDDLGRDRLDLSPIALATCASTRGIDLREGADRARDRAGRDLLARADQALAWRANSA